MRRRGGPGGKHHFRFPIMRRGKPPRPLSDKTVEAPRGRFLVLPRVPIGCIVVGKVFQNRLANCFRAHIWIVMGIETMSKSMAVRAQRDQVVRCIESTLAARDIVMELQISGAAA